VEWLMVVALVAVGAAILFGIYWIRRHTAKTIIEAAEKESKRLLKEAELQAENIIRRGELEAKEKLLEITAEFERKTQSKREELSLIEKKLMDRDEQLEKRASVLDKREADLETRNQQAKEALQRVRENERRIEELGSRA